MKSHCLSVLILLILFFSVPAYSQAPCEPPPIVFNKTTENIFDETQEMYLGEVIAEQIEKDFRIIRDEEANRIVRAIGERLTRHLPPTNIRFQFIVVDIPEVNAFAVAGGRIYVTRKLVAFVNSEDELAGIIGHELGHAIVRHNSADMSRLFREILNVNSVGDRNDVFQKYHQLLDHQNTKRVRIKRSHQGEQQLEADRVGLFAMVAAGYDPNAFANAWERLTEAKGTGGGFSSIFSGTRPEEKRLREMLKAISTVSPSCVEKKKENSTADFLAWQSYVVTNRNFGQVERLPGLIIGRPLKPYLRGEIRHFQFSPNGEHIIAQDSSGINVLQREPFKFLFRIEAENAKPAMFTPDSTGIVFQTYGLRVEKWNIKTTKPEMVREVYVRGGCLQSALSPNGKYLACYSPLLNLDIVEVENNNIAYRKEDFYEPRFYESYFWIQLRLDSSESEMDVLQMEFSPDGRYFLAGKVTRGVDYLFGPGLDVRISGQQAILAYDFSTNSTVKLKGELKNIVSMPFAFYSGDKLIGQHIIDADKSGIFTFPEGKQVEKFYMNANSYSTPHKGDYVIVRPTTTNPVGVYDLKQKKFIASNKTPAMDGYGEFFVSEGRDGYVDLFKLDIETKGLTRLGSVLPPNNDLGDIRAIALSPDLEWLALSEGPRGGIWNLKTGERKIYIRGFRAAFFDEEGKVFADFPKFEKQDRRIGIMNKETGEAELLEPLDIRNARQFGDVLFRFKTKYDDRLEKREQEQKAKGEMVKGDQSPKPATSDEPVTRFFTGVDDSTFEVYDTRSRNLLWSKQFANEMPAYYFDSRTRSLVFYWNVKKKAARAELKNRHDLAEKLKELGDKDGDYYVQVLDSRTGNLIGDTLIETGEGSFYITAASAVGDWLTIVDSENRVLIYSLSKDELIWRFFGSTAAVNPDKGFVVIENLPGQLTAYDLKTGEKVEQFDFSSGISYLRFNADGSRMFVICENQEYFIFDTNRFTQAANP